MGESRAGPITHHAVSCLLKKSCLRTHLTNMNRQVSCLHPPSASSRKSALHYRVFRKANEYKQTLLSISSGEISFQAAPMALPEDAVLSSPIDLDQVQEHVKNATSDQEAKRDVELVAEPDIGAASAVMCINDGELEARLRRLEQLRNQYGVRSC